MLPSLWWCVFVCVFTGWKIWETNLTLSCDVCHAFSGGCRIWKPCLSCRLGFFFGGAGGVFLLASFFYKNVRWCLFIVNCIQMARTDQTTQLAFLTNWCYAASVCTTMSFISLKQRFTMALNRVIANPID